MQRPLLYLKSTIFRFCINTHRNAPMLGNRSCNVESISSGWFFSHFEGIFITIGKDTLIYCNVKVFEGENINIFSNFWPFCRACLWGYDRGLRFWFDGNKKGGSPLPFSLGRKTDSILMAFTSIRLCAMPRPRGRSTQTIIHKTNKINSIFERSTAKVDILARTVNTDKK